MLIWCAICTDVLNISYITIKSAWDATECCVIIKLYNLDATEYCVIIKLYSLDATEYCAIIKLYSLDATEYCAIISYIA